MDVFVLTEHRQIYDIIKHVNKDCVHTIYFDPQKYPVYNKFKGDNYSLLCKDLATSAINRGYQIVKNAFYIIDGVTLIGFPVTDAFNIKVTLNADNKRFFVQNLSQ